MDREKVIKGLETCIPMKYETNEEKECRHEQCPYGRENYKPMNGCFWDLMSDALALLKEQNQKTGKWIEKTDYMGDTYYDCSACGESWMTIDGTPWQNGMNYCPHCGAKMEGR